MFLELLRCEELYAVLQRYDEDLAQEVARRPCGRCGGPMHRADFPRAPRAPIPLPAGYCRRISYCCGRDGCRTRCTPPSVRFLGRRVVLGAVVLVAAAMMQGPTPRRAKEIQRVLGVDVATLRRWRKWWLEVFPRSMTWHVLRPRIAVEFDATLLPRSFIDRFAHHAELQVAAALRSLQMTEWEMVVTSTQRMPAIRPIGPP